MKLKINKIIFKASNVNLMVWSTIYFLLFLFNNEIGSLNILTHFIIIFGIIFFSMGNYVGSKTNLKINRRIIKVKNLLNLKLMYSFSIIIIILAVKIALKDAALINEGSFLFRLRYTQLYIPNRGYSYLAYFMAFYTNLGICMSVLYYNKQISKIFFVYSQIVSIIITALSTNRLNMFVYVISIFFIFTLYRKVNIKIILFIIASLMSIFIGVAFLTYKLGDLKYTLINYTIAGIKGLDAYLQTDYKLSYGDNTFGIIKGFLKKIGILEPLAISNTLEGYFKIENTKIISNVFSIYKPLISDFGYFYPLFVLFLIGLIMGNLYKKALQNSFVSICLYTLMLAYLIFNFFDDMYFRITSSWIQVILTFIIFKYLFIKSKKEESISL